MSDKSLMLQLPEELIERAEAAHLDLRQVLLEALEQKLPRESDGIKPSLEEVEAAIEASKKRIASGEADLRILGLDKGTVWMSDDFDDPLPDEFWFGENP